MNNTQRAITIAKATYIIKVELAKQYGDVIYRATEGQLYSYLDSAEMTEALETAIDTLNTL